MSRWEQYVQWLWDSGSWPFPVQLLIGLTIMLGLAFGAAECIKAVS